MFTDRATTGLVHISRPVGLGSRIQAKTSGKQSVRCLHTEHYDKGLTYERLIGTFSVDCSSCHAPIDLMQLPPSYMLDSEVFRKKQSAKERAESSGIKEYVVVSYLPCTCPFRSIKNFVKFHLIPSPAYMSGYFSCRKFCIHSPFEVWVSKP